MHLAPALHSELRTLFQKFAGILGTQLATALVQLAIIALVAASYGPAGNGVYVVSMLLPTTLATFLNLGVNAANVYYLGGAYAHPRTVVGTSVVLTIGLGLLGLALGGVMIHLHGEVLFPGIAPRVLWMALAIYPISLAQGFINSIFHGLQKFRELSCCILAQPAITLLLVGMLVLTDASDLLLLIWANLIGALATAILSGWLLKRALNVFVRPRDPHYLRKALKYGYKAYLSNLFTFLQSRADTFLINLLINPAAAGIYAIAFQLGEKLWMLSQAVSVVLLPKLSELASEEHRRITITTLISRLVLAISALGAVCFAVIAYPLIVLVFGDQYRDSYVPLLLLLPGIVALAGARVLANDIAARGKPELNMYMALAGLAMTITGNLILVPRFGIYGAAAMTSIAYTVDLGLKMLAYRMLTGTPMGELLILRWFDVKHLRSLLKFTPPAQPDIGPVRL